MCMIPISKNGSIFMRISTLSERFALALPTKSPIVMHRDSSLKENSFTEIGLSQDLIAKLKELSIHDPTPVQLMGIPTARKCKNVVIASETGSGKTLAYLIPMMESIKASECKQKQLLEANEISLNHLHKPKHPKGIILVPTNELVLQAKEVAKFLAKTYKLRIAAFFHNMTAKYYKNLLNTPMDMLIATPSKLLNLHQNEQLSLTQLKFLVIDEGDSLVEEESNFGADISSIIQLLNSNSQEEQPNLIIVTATMTKAFNQSIRTMQKTLLYQTPFTHVISPGLHKPPKSLVQSFIRITQRGNEKQRRTASMLKANPKQKFLIFCDKIVSMETLRGHLESQGIKHYSWQKNESPELLSAAGPMYDCIHGHLTVQRRKELLSEFQDSKFNILIASALTARGFDFKQVDQVILYDFPKNPVDYLHRIGRTARAFSTGKVTSFITGATCKVANQIRKFLSRNERITGDCHEPARPPKSSLTFKFRQRLRAKQQSYF